MAPLADRLAHRYRVALPDIRGYGTSICRDPALHRWDQYVADVVAVVKALDSRCAHLIGAGLGGTIALRTCLSHPYIVRSAVVISAEAIEDDAAKAADTRLMDLFAERVRTHGLQ
ncbi:MAG: alpha/beta fold hydrolase, partial [Microbacteriaceae bacterium]